MKIKTYYFLVITSILFTALVYFFNNRSEDKILGSSQEVILTPSPTVEVTPTFSPSPSLTPTASSSATPTFSPSLKPTSTKTPVLTPMPASSEEINGFIDRFAGQYGVDPNVLRHIALCESDFDSNAVFKDYVGLFQFGPITWVNIRTEIGENTDPNLRFNAEESIQTAAYALSEGKGGIWPNCLP